MSPYRIQCNSSSNRSPLGYSVIVVLTGLAIGYSVIVTLTLSNQDISVYHIQHRVRLTKESTQLLKKTQTAHSHADNLLDYTTNKIKDS